MGETERGKRKADKVGEKERATKRKIERQTEREKERHTGVLERALSLFERAAEKDRHDGREGDRSGRDRKRGSVGERERERERRRLNERQGWE